MAWATDNLGHHLLDEPMRHREFDIPVLRRQASACGGLEGMVYFDIKGKSGDAFP